MGGPWLVSGQRGRSYTVAIVDGSGQHDSCTCPDFLCGKLGLCRQREAVRRAIHARPTLHRPYRALPNVPTHPTLTIHTVGPPEREGARITHAVRPAAARLASRADLTQRTARFHQACQEGKVGVDVLNKHLFPYQKEGVVHLAAKGRALLADDMGLGKTVQAIAACEVMRARGELDRVIVITPASIKHQWAQESEHDTGRHAVVVTGNAAHRAAALASSTPYKILSYELTWREWSRLPKPGHRPPDPGRGPARPELPHPDRRHPEGHPRDVPLRPDRHPHREPPGRPV